MKTKRQIIIIGGGMTFSSKSGYISYLKNREVSIEKKESWKDRYLDVKLGDTYDIIRLKMPCPENAKYIERKIHFEKYIPFIKKNSIFIGVSLGGIFLAKYLSENVLPQKVSKLLLVCPPYDNSIPLEELVGGFTLKKDISLIEKNTGKAYLLFSKNDLIVPPDQAEKYRKKLPHSQIEIYGHIEGHFQVSEFPEILTLIE